MKTPFHYQDEDADLLARGEVMGLASDPGCGKTFTALLAAQRAGYRRIVVCCPAVARPVWYEEVEEFDLWTPLRLSDVLESGADYRLDGPFVLICGYEHLVASQPARELLFNEIGAFDLLICDEAHYLKNPAARRTTLVYDDLAEHATATWPLSGTFMLNHPGELWSHLNLLAPDRIDHMNYFVFTHTYCRWAEKRIGRGKVVQKIVGADKARAPELKDRMTGLFARRRADISNLPPLNFRMRPVEHDRRAQRELEAAYSTNTEADRQIRAALAAPDPLAALNTLDAHLARIRTAMALAKVPAMVSIVEDLMENTCDKVLLWVWHMKPFDRLLEALPDAVSIRGDTTVKKREDAVRRFQNDPETRVFIGQIQAAGTAITLTKATREIFLEQAFTPALNFQAAKRAHRIGQTQSVFCETLYLPDTVDEAIIRLLNAKLGDIRLLEGAV